MDLVGIFNVVDTPSSGKCDFNYIYAVGWIVSILIHFWIISVWISSYWFCIDLSSLVFIQCSCFGMVVAGCTKNVDLHCPFLTVCFLSIFTVLSLVLGVILFSIELCGFPSFFWHMWMIVMEIDHPAIRVLNICFFIRSNILFCFQWIVMVLPSWFCCSWMTMVWLDHPMVIHTENVTQKFTYTNILMHIYTCAFQPLYPFIILL